MKRTATIIAMLVAMPWYLALAADVPGQAEKTLSANQNRLPLLASQVKPPAPPVITGTGLPPEAHLSGEIQGRSDIIHPVQGRAGLPRQIPLRAARPTAANRPLEEKSDEPGIPDTPDPSVILQGGDTFFSATQIATLPYYDTGTTVGYTNDYEGNCGGSGAPDVVYRYDSPIDTLLNISLCDATDYDSKVYVCVNADRFNIVACNDDDCGLASSIHELHVAAGNSYFIVVDGYNSNSGNYSINVSLAAFIPNPCDYGGDAVFSNLRTDGADGESDFQSTDGTIDRWGIDDMTIYYDHVFVTGINWLCLSTDNFDWNSTADVMILLDNGGTPGSIYYDFPDVPCTRTATGRNLFGYDEYVYLVSGLSGYLTSGTYWIAARPNSSPSSNNFWESAPVQGSPCYISMPDLGYPMWSPGSSVFGVDRDLSFCVMGNFGADPCAGTASLWHNGNPNYLNGWYDFRTTDGLNDFFIVDNVYFPNPTLIHAFNWVTVDNLLDWDGTADFIIMADAGGAPGAVILEIYSMPCSRIATGNFPFGFPEYVYSISGRNIYLPSGQFWVGLRPVGWSGASYWMITPGDGQQSYVDYSSLGYPRWTPSTTALGGSYDFSFCIEGEFTPPPDPCTGGTLIFSSGFPDMLNGLNVGRSTDGLMNMTVVADVELSQDAVLNDFHWFVLEIGDDWNGDADLLILSDNAGTPGSVVYSQNDIAATRIPTGRVLFGIPEYTFGITGAGITLPTGNYWIGLRPVSNTPTSFYWETAPLFGNQVFVDYPDYGYPAWSPGNLPYGTTYDVSFCINGELAGGCSFVVGDVNNNGAFNGIDVSYSVGYFKGGPVPPYTCECNSSTWFVAGDVNGNCAFNGIDVSYMVSYFKGGSAPIPCPACAPTVLDTTPIVIPSSSLNPDLNREITITR